MIRIAIPFVQAHQRATLWEVQQGLGKIRKAWWKLEIGKCSKNKTHPIQGLALSANARQWRNRDAHPLDLIACIDLCTADEMRPGHFQVLFGVSVDQALELQALDSRCKKFFQVEQVLSDRARQVSRIFSEESRKCFSRWLEDASRRQALPQASSKDNAVSEFVGPFLKATKKDWKRKRDKEASLRMTLEELVSSPDWAAIAKDLGLSAQAGLDWKAKLSK